MGDMLPVPDDAREDRTGEIDHMYAQLLLEQPDNQFLWDRVEERTGKRRPPEREPGEDDA